MYEQFNHTVQESLTSYGVRVCMYSKLLKPLYVSAVNLLRVKNLLIDLPLCRHQF